MSLLDEFQKALHTHGEVTLSIRVRPNASENRVRGILSDGAVKIDIAATPEQGKASVALLGFLAQEFVVPRENVELMSGPLSRMKIVRIVLK